MPVPVFRFHALAKDEKLQALQHEVKAFLFANPDNAYRLSEIAAHCLGETPEAISTRWEKESPGEMAGWAVLVAEISEVAVKTEGKTAYFHAKVPWTVDFAFDTEWREAPFVSLRHIETGFSIELDEEPVKGDSKNLADYKLGPNVQRLFELLTQHWK